MKRAAVLFALLAAREASAACQRPTDPAGFKGYAYAPDQAYAFDGVKVRVWYAKSGKHAVNVASTRMDMVPDNVARAAEVGDGALAKLAQMGFLAPVSDQGCGGDDKLDLYLMHFNAADGDASAETCVTQGKAQRCSALALVEAKMESSYGSFDLGARVVIPHEIFHAVQMAYDANLDRFWSEGTAQWAAKTLDPTTRDLEAFLPEFFFDATRSIDITSGGVTSGYIYGAAIFPVFLTEHVGPDLVRLALERHATLGAPSMGAVGAALEGAGSSLAAVYPTFAAWNLGTGKRAGSVGYKDAASYPMVSGIPAFPEEGSASAIASGFSIFYWSYDFGGAPRELTLEGDPARVGARVVPLTNGKVDLDAIATLPAIVKGPGLLAVAGVSTKKTDAPFTVKVGPPSAPGSDAGAADAGDAKQGGGGCEVSGGRSGAWLAALALLAMLRSRAPRRATRSARS